MFSKELVGYLMFVDVILVLPADEIVFVSHPKRMAGYAVRQ